MKDALRLYLLLTQKRVEGGICNDLGMQPNFITGTAQEMVILPFVATGNITLLKILFFGYSSVLLGVR